MKNPINKKQIQLIHIAKQQLNIDDDLYRDILQNNFNVSSSKELTNIQAEQLLRFFRSKGFRIVKPAHNKAKLGNKTIKIASPAQFKLIEVLKSNIVWKISYEAWLNNWMKIKRVITSRDAAKVIEGLKGMLGINTKHIEFLMLPFPTGLDLNSLKNQWFFDILENKLIYVEDGDICRIIK